MDNDVDRDSNQSSVRQVRHDSITESKQSTFSAVIWLPHVHYPCIMQYSIDFTKNMTDDIKMPEST